MPYGPYVTIDLDKIEHNARTITTLCGKHGIEVCGVTKVTCGMPQVAKAMLRGGVACIGESRMKNIHRLKANGVAAEFTLLRIPPLSAADDIVTSVDMSLNSELSVIQALSEAAFRRGLVHNIMIMVDLGDLREGVWPDDLLPMVREVVELPGIRIAGLGTNLSCYGGIVPSGKNMNQLVDHARRVETAFDIKLRYISGGNSSSLNLIASGKMPRGVNHIRIGEGILLGRETIHRRAWPDAHQDAFLLHAEIIELKEKPSVPIGETGEDAFGGRPEFVDKGERDRAILNIGREDVVVEGLKPVEPNISILGASSDHLIADVTEAEHLQLGGELAFFMNYGALLAAMTSEYVEKRPMRGIELVSEHRHVVLAEVSSRDKAESHPIVNIEELAAGLNQLGVFFTRRQHIRDDRKVVSEAMAEIIDEDLVPLVYANDPKTCPGIYQGLALSLPFLGAIIFSAHGSSITAFSELPVGPGGEAPRLESERIVFVGLREVSSEESQLVRRSRISAYTLEDIDALGMREVMYRALRTASMGTDGIHVTLDMDALDTSVAPAVSRPVRGGLSYREGHLAMEMIAKSGLMRSLAVVDYVPEKDVNRATADAATEYVLSLFGKKILRI
ncbi:MAG: arginase family protein [Desulfobacteraceae bacterium]|nr:arginase family protein [Desulfobacteraceae bacterium]